MSVGFGMGGFPDAMFSIVPVIVCVGFVMVFGMFIAAAVQGGRTWNKNNHSPRLTVPARVVTKRTCVSHHHRGGMETAHAVSSTAYYATFQVESGDRMEFAVGGSEYGMLAEGDQGELTFQGTRYLSFVRT